MKVNVPGGGQPDGLREDGGKVVGHTVEGFGPPVIGRDAQAWYRRRGHLHQHDFLVQRQEGNDVLHALLHRQFGIVERRQGVRTRCRLHRIVAAARARGIRADCRNHTCRLRSLCNCRQFPNACRYGDRRSDDFCGISRC